MTKANKMGAGREVPRIRTNSLSLCSKKVDQTGQIHTCKNKNKPKELRCKLQLKAQRTVCCLKKDTQVSAAIVSQSAMINKSKAAKRRFNSFAFFRSPPGYPLGIWLSGQEAIGPGGWDRFRMFLKWQEKIDQERLHFPDPTVGNIQLGYFYASSRRLQHGTLILVFLSPTRSLWHPVAV